MSKYAQVYTNDPTRKVITLTLTFPVEKFADITPSIVRFNGTKGSVLKRQVKVVPGEKNPFTIVDSRTKDGRHIRYEIKEDTDPDSERPVYFIDVENTMTQAGSYQDVIYLKTDSELRPTLQIRVYGNIHDQKQRETRQPAGKLSPAPNENISL